MKKGVLLLIFFSLIMVAILLPAGAQTRGDVNNDTSINIIDALLIAQYYVGLDPPTFFPQAGDINCDSSINILDALLVAQYYVGILTVLPACPGTEENTLTIELVGRDLLKDCLDAPYIDPPDQLIGVNSKYKYATGTTVNLYFVSATPPPQPGSGEFPVEYQTAGFEGYTGNNIEITMDTDRTLRIAYITHVLNPPDGTPDTTPYPTMVGDNYCYQSSNGVFVIEPDVPNPYGPEMSESLRQDNTLPGFTGDGYIVCDGLPSYISFGLDTTSSETPYYEVRLRIWNEDSNGWTFEGYTQPAMFQFADNGKTWVKLFFSSVNYIVDRIIVFPEGTPESDWQDLERNQSYTWTSVNNIVVAHFTIR
jgi:hypothetical protein